MKKVTAIVRRDLVGEIIRAIKDAGCRCISAVDIDGLADLVDPEKEHISFEYEAYYMKMSRIEVLCRDDSVETVMESIKRHGRTAHAGDGFAFITAVERAAEIKSGEEGEGMLRMKV